MLGVQVRVNLDLPNRVLLDGPEARYALATAFRTYRPAVVIAPPAFWTKPSGPVPSVLTLIVICPEPAPPTFASRTTASPLERVTLPVPVAVGPAI